MISKQASTLPRRLLRRYGTSVPFELADCLGITILECHDFKLQKGAFKVILNNFSSCLILPFAIMELPFRVTDKLLLILLWWQNSSASAL